MIFEVCKQRLKSAGLTAVDQKRKRKKEKKKAPWKKWSEFHCEKINLREWKLQCAVNQPEKFHDGYNPSPLGALPGPNLPAGQTNLSATLSRRKEMAINSQLGSKGGTLVRKDPISLHFICESFRMKPIPWEPPDRSSQTSREPDGRSSLFLLSYKTNP